MAASSQTYDGRDPCGARPSYEVSGVRLRLGADVLRRGLALLLEVSGGLGGGVLDLGGRVGRGLLEVLAHLLADRLGLLHQRGALVLDGVHDRRGGLGLLLAGRDETRDDDAGAEGDQPRRERAALDLVLGGPD